MNSLKTGLAIALLTACGALAAQDVAYRWVDDEGVTHFSDRPPADSIQADILDIPDYQPPAAPHFSYVAMLERLNALERELEESRNSREPRPTQAPVIVQPVHTVERVATPVFFPHRHGFRHIPHPRTPARQAPRSSFDRLVEGVRDRYTPPDN